MKNSLKVFFEACRMVLLGCFLLGVICFSLWLKSVEDRLSDHTRIPGRWVLIPFPW